MQQEWKNGQIRETATTIVEPGIYKIDHQMVWYLRCFLSRDAKPAVIEALEGLKKAETEAEEAKQVGQRFLE